MIVSRLPEGMHAMSGMGRQPPIDLHTILTDWQSAPFAIALAASLAALAIWYLRAARRLGERGRHWPVWHTWSFVASLAVVEVALGSSVAGLAGSSFSAHVIQHLLLMIVAPPLAALGRPMTLALQTSGRPTKRRLLWLLHSRVFAVISHPVPVFFLYYLSMYAFFLTGALGYAMSHMWLMDVVNLGFLGGATLFWWPMVGLDPIPRWEMTPGLKLLNLMIGVPVESFLGVALLMATKPVASMYSLSSTRTGGGLLWAATELATIGAIAPVFAQWTRADARQARRIDAHLAAGGTIDPPLFDGHGLAATFRSLRRG